MLLWRHGSLVALERKKFIFNVDIAEHRPADEVPALRVKVVRRLRITEFKKANARMLKPVPTAIRKGRSGNGRIITATRTQTRPPLERRHSMRL